MGILVGDWGSSDAGDVLMARLQHLPSRLLAKQLSHHRNCKLAPDQTLTPLSLIVKVVS